MKHCGHVLEEQPPFNAEPYKAVAAMKAIDSVEVVAQLPPAGPVIPAGTLEARILIGCITKTTKKTNNKHTS
jgi:hypothetical protein